MSFFHSLLASKIKGGIRWCRHLAHQVECDK
jgi:hypothetical protein